MPIATYRVQLNKEFDLANLKQILPYLSQLGISHIYASPIFKAKHGSTHGYDIIDFNKISDEIGGETAFEDVRQEASAYGLEWLQDIVPNHASYSLENKMINDLMYKGANSRYSAYFDVDWNYPAQRLNGKILAPFLAEPYSQCLKQKYLSLVFNEGYKIKYNSLQFPTNDITSRKLNKHGSTNQAIEQYNGNSELLAELLAAQFYKLSHWKTALKHINYRRFFDIIDLIGLHIEDPHVFEEIQRLTLDLAKNGVFSALRIDHIDGLYEPEEYLKRLRDKLPHTYLAVEKILAGNEQLPPSWPVQGTTGYDFINFVNKLLVKASGESQINSFYSQFSGSTQSFSDLLHDCKRLVIENYFLGDARNLARLYHRTLQCIGYGEQYDRGNLVEAVVELLACFQIYRSYINEHNHDYTTIKTALHTALEQKPTLNAEFAAINHLLEQSKPSPEILQVLMRLQQFTGAVMAKGFEDTALYRYCRLLSLNEVGSEPDQFGISIKAFHDFNRLRQQTWPLTMNATSSHDTKRGEDVRARLNVLSELAAEFKCNVECWTEINASKKRVISGRLAPNKNEEYYLYQTFLGAFPWNSSEKQEFTDRIKTHIVKALREAKANSSWLTPNLPYEEAVSLFAVNTLDDERFQEAFEPFQEKVAFYGLFNTLAQTLLKMTCPGIPDFYQGTELWDLNLVDPDNRRAVDFAKRQAFLSEISKLEVCLLDNYKDGKAKLYLIHRVLQFRKKARSLFQEGAYIPLPVRGVHRTNIVAFCRKKSGVYAITVVPLFLATLTSAQSNRQELYVDWANTYLALPEEVPTTWTDVLTEVEINAQSRRLPIREVLRGFPAALLQSGDRSE